MRDLNWFNITGDVMSDEEWSEGYAKSLMVFLNGDGIPYMGLRGEPVRDDSMLILFNAYYEPLPFTLPGPGVRRVVGGRRRHRGLGGARAEAGGGGQDHRGRGRPERAAPHPHPVVTPAPSAARCWRRCGGSG